MCGTVSSKLLPRYQLVFQDRVALLKTLTAIVTRIFNEEVVLKHLLGHKLRQEAHVRLRIDLDERRLLASHFGQLVHDLGWRVVALCSEDASA